MAELFVNPWMLGGLAALSAPIIIHLLNKRRFQIVDWAAMDFLLQAESKNRRRIQVEDLLLLFLRMLLLALLVFAVARPVLQGFVGHREDERHVVVDDSFSMEASGGAGIPFVAAQASAQSYVEEAIGRGMGLTVWQGTRGEQLHRLERAADETDANGSTGDAGEPSPPSESALAVYAARASEVLTGLRRMRSLDASLSVGRLFERLRERFTGREKPLLRSVVLISDFRSSDWRDSAGALRPEIAASIANFENDEILERIDWRLVDVGRPSSENLAVTAVRVATDLPAVGAPVRILVEVVNHGPDERRNLRGAVEIGSPEPTSRGVQAATPPRRVALNEIPLLAAGSSVTTEAVVEFDASGEYPLTAMIEGAVDRLPIDDRSFGVVRVRKGIRVLLVDGDARGDRFESDSGHLAAALAPRGPFPSGVLVERTTGEITAELTRDRDVVLVLNRSGISTDEVGVLRRFVRQGGGLGYFVGNRVEPERYAALAGLRSEASAPASSDAELRLFPAKILSATSPKERAHLRISDVRHAAFEAFRGVEGSSIEQVGFDRLFTLEPVDGALVVARFDDPANTPAIVELQSIAGEDEATTDAAPSETPDPVRRRAAGKVVLFNLTADRDWNDWPADPSFPIVMQEWARYLAPRMGDERTVTAGGVLAWPWAPGLAYTVRTPDGEAFRFDPTAPDSQSAISVNGRYLYFRETYRAGIYWIVPSRSVEGAVVDESALAPIAFACTRDPDESRLDPDPLDSLRPELESLGMRVSVTESEGGGLRVGESGGEVWRWLATAAGIVLLAELLFAWWLGRRGA